MKTEAQAREMTCHKTMALTPPDPRPCVGSECMAWRWDVTDHGKHEMAFGRIDVTLPQTGGMMRGRCGLAGPE